MTNLEKGVLNSIEDAKSKVGVLHENRVLKKLVNDFDLAVTRDTIELIDGGYLVAHFDQGYIQLSQIVPLIAEIIEPCE